MKPSKVFLLILSLLALVLVVAGAYQTIKLITAEKKIPAVSQKSEPAKKTAEVFKPETLTWKNVLPEAPWRARDSGEVFLWQNKLWLMGGLNADEQLKNNHVVEYWLAPHFNDIWNTADGVTWTKVATSSAWSPRRSMSVVYFKDKLWMFGGWSPVGGYTNDIWTSTDGINWEQLATRAAWPAREGQLAEVFNGKIWLFGGVNYDERQAKNDVWYSANGIDWFEAKNIPWSPRWDHAIAIFNNKLFLVGGMNLTGDTFKDVWQSADGLNWTLVTADPSWTLRQGHALKAYRGKLWLIGRLNDSENGGVNDVWYSDDGLTWNKTTTDPAWTGREDFFSAVWLDKLWVFGGMDADWRWRNDVWVSDFPQVNL